MKNKPNSFFDNSGFPNWGGGGEEWGRGDGGNESVSQGGLINPCSKSFWGVAQGKLMSIL